MGSRQTKTNTKYILPGLFFLNQNVIDISKVQHINLDFYDRDSVINLVEDDKLCRFLFYVLYHKDFIALKPKTMSDIYFIDDNYSALLHIHMNKNKNVDPVLVVNIDEIDRFIF